MDKQNNKKTLKAIGRYVCKTCGAAYKHRSHLSRHNQDHKGMKFPCVFCQKTYKRREGQQHHLTQGKNPCSSKYIEEALNGNIIPLPDPGKNNETSKTNSLYIEN